MKEMMAPGRHPLEFREAYLHPEKETDWDMIYDGFDAAVDWYAEHKTRFTVVFRAHKVVLH